MKVANAVGAALSQVSGTFDQLVEMSPSSRDDVIRKAKEYAIEEAVQNGALRETCTILDISEVRFFFCFILFFLYFKRTQVNTTSQYTHNVILKCLRRRVVDAV